MVLLEQSIGKIMNMIGQEFPQTLTLTEQVRL